MAVVLYPHNQSAYYNALNMLEESGKAAVIHPTGTGKSFIAFKLAEEHPGKCIIWLAPSEYIFQSQKQNYLDAGGDENALSGITFLTYSKLMYGMWDFDDALVASRAVGIRDNAPDYIVLDEFHRCGAESWGRCVHLLMEAYPKAKVLGLSATNIRYLDSRRDMAEELFEGKIASRMELTEAMASGILPAPFYICALYEYRDELRKISKRVNGQRNLGVKDESLKMLDKLRQSLQQANEPEKIFAKYMKRNGKYIVFCSGREHMREMIDLAAKWYGKVDSNPTIYRAIYDNEDSPETVRAFSADQSEHLKLLFCIDMLNEGVHVADVDGVILLRPTASPTLYLQQVGRALSVSEKSKNTQPLIFDLVDNFDSLKCIDSFLEEYKRVGNGESEEKEERRYDFRLIDETRESRRLFEQLQQCLSSSWEMCFREAEQYYRQYGDLKVPKRYITESGIALGSWLITQRRVRAGAVPGNLTQEQIQQLDSLGMEWESRIGKAWETGYQELVKYRSRNGHVDVPSRYVTDTGYPLGRFVTNQRIARKNAKAGKMSSGRILLEERERKLDALGFVWEKQRLNWERYFSAAKKFYEKEGHLNVPARYVTEDGLKLGAWLSYKTSERGSLTEEEANALATIGMSKENCYEAKWEEKFNLAKQYYQEHGNLEVPKEYMVQGVRLGRWVNALRSARVRPESSHYKLDAERIKKLDAIGMRWAGDDWECRYRLAELYYQEHGDLHVSQAYVVETQDGRIWLGKWLAAQKKKRYQSGAKHALSMDQEKRLEAIGMEW